MGDEGGEIPVRLLIADDHALVRQGLRGMLEREPDIEVVGEAHNGREAVDLCRAIKHERPEIEVLMVTMHDNKDYTQEATKAGVAGYVLKDAPRDELIDAVRRIASPTELNTAP
jgi:two-component system, NarL family, response regulator LiaR